jgi:RND family efflux transporter MFP subunit
LKTDPHTPINGAPESDAERLLRENHELRRQIAELKDAGQNAVPEAMWRPSGITIAAIFLMLVVLTAVAFLGGYIPMQKRQTLIASEAVEQEHALPRVEAIEVGRSSSRSDLELPGSIQAITEAPLLARADGYVLRRMVDIGDRVQAGQPLAEMEAPEMDDQIRQARAGLRQAEVSVDQALANFEKGKAETELARVTAQRYASLTAQGVVSRQENDRYEAQLQALVAAQQALDKAVAVQRGTVSAAQSNVARLERIQGYRIVKAPFDGVVTMRNVDVGALVNAGSTLLFRVAQTNTLRIYLNVPQTHSSSIRTGQAARVSVSNLPGREFNGFVARTASALDPASRTMLVEVHLSNPGGLLLPGMYARVNLMSPRTNAPLLIPSDALIARGDGTTVAVVRPDRTVHLQKIEVGRDFGDKLEVMNGLKDGDLIVPNPGDMAREGLKVELVERRPATAEK